MTKEQARELVECTVCDKNKTCPYNQKYQRMPREFFKGALSLCPKIKNMRF